MRTLFALAVAAVAGLTIPSQAAVNLAVAAPGGDIVGYATPTVYLVKGSPANFLNADPLAPHDVVARAKSLTGQPIFRSGPASGGELTPISGVETLAVGRYEFYCSFHSATMLGILDVRE